MASAKSTVIVVDWDFIFYMKIKTRSISQVERTSEMFKLNLPTLSLWKLRLREEQYSRSQTQPDLTVCSGDCPYGKCMNLRIWKIHGIPVRHPLPQNSSSCIGAMGNCLHSLGSKHEAPYQSLCEDGAPHSGAGPSAQARENGPSFSVPGAKR